ncbi:MAG: hypothetical protein HY901_32190, partial [Deltaproteobacteria bacterium]|nr:hypothetical protein [Deltaproteobacteria bacterium]
LRLLHPFWLLKHRSNNAHALASAQLGLRGEGATYGGANAGAQALSAALRCLAAGAADAAVVMAYDSLIEPEALVELEAAGAITRVWRGLRSAYDEGAAGFVPGEGAAALVLEPVAKSADRALAHVSALDAADGSAQEPEPSTVERLVRELGGAGTQAVDGAGWARPALDRAEREAVGSVVDEGAALTCLAAAFGQTGAAASLIQVIALSACLAKGRLPPVAGLHKAAPGPMRVLSTTEDTRARHAIGLCGGAPGLLGGVRVELP